ncbi:MAG: electron transporter RnfC [Bacteroidetes bacterium GWF2_42_66]|nr:MAG: electron transporter RnfC [Bacteroidetes bacterium GWA2_42_15]OFY02181.1 MAG: electron transporter RnfC [Bacteroidetes bacterium GWE2_42_39]OFY43628.1 MAG: electron transporter RnfC [Bacteroidetes bacterium GWF2_42_66]HBL75261.1 electron transport complex subunit RsxC [Prolixibacteraceae bacterium]HCR91224.1 electron transport complex subunit RsxC [Prolixibacteraceae bacterium]
MLKTFKLGGVHPAENKLSAGRAIEELQLPKTVNIPVAQHIGAPAVPTVAKGDKVKVGQVIARSSGFVSTNIHSSVSGTVAKIETVPDTSGYPKIAVIITVEGDEWIETIDRSAELKTDFNLDGKAVIDKILEAGIVGLGGATFPTHVKMVPPQGMKAEVLLINGVECEPYLTSDHRLMLEKGPEIVVGAKLLMKALNVEKAAIGIENNKPDAISLLQEITKNDPQISVVPLKVKYPQGGEKQLIKGVTGREVPSGALPIAVGVVVSNVGTAFAVYEAVQKNKPLFERVVTVTGKSVSKPSNFKVRIGTAISELIEAAGGLPEDTGKIISGGPMMGKAVATTEVSVTKGTSGIVLIKEDEARRGTMENCIRCSRCVSVCPMGLEPYYLMTVSDKQIWDKAENYKIMDCMECGSCSYTCPSNRPLLDYIRLGKGKVGQIIRSRK